MMKKYIAIFGLGVLGLTFSSCEKEPSFNYPDGTVGISKVTNYATFTFKGDQTTLVVKGTPFVDPGVTVTEGTTPLTPTVTGTVDVNTVGVYKLVYSATNKDGFDASVTRMVIVYDTKADAVANDLSGSYLRAATGVSAVWTKLGPGVYSVDNPGGASGVNFVVIVFNPTGYTITIPSQLANNGTPVSSTTESYDPITGTLKWVIINQGYGSGLRTFVKQ